MSEQLDLTLPITALTSKAEDKGKPWISVFATTPALGLFFHRHVLHVLQFPASSRGKAQLQTEKCRTQAAQRDAGSRSPAPGPAAARCWAGTKLGHLPHPPPGRPAPARGCPRALVPVCTLSILHGIYKHWAKCGQFISAASPRAR